MIHVDLHVVFVYLVLVSIFFFFFEEKIPSICVNDINAVHELYNEINVTPSRIIDEFLRCFLVQQILFKNFEASSVQPSQPLLTIGYNFF